VALPEAVEILEARAVLEGWRSGGPRPTPPETDVVDLRAILAEMRRLLDGGDLLNASNTNAILHKRLVQMAATTTANRLISGLRSQLSDSSTGRSSCPAAVNAPLAEHTAIVDAVAAGDPRRRDRDAHPPVACRRRPARPGPAH